MASLDSAPGSFEVPSWAGIPPPGLHLDVMKDGKLVQKLMMDSKRAYFFGRNRGQCDVLTEHSSCSRVHAVLVWHSVLSRPFLVDLGSSMNNKLGFSAHGTFIGRIRCDSRKPTQVPSDAELHFGESTRRYVLREPPRTAAAALSQQSSSASAAAEGDEGADGEDGAAGGARGTNPLAEVDPTAHGLLPEDDAELDNLTEFNTAHNRRAASLPVPAELEPRRRARRPMALLALRFADEVQIINPEDIDPNIGKFRNLAQTMIIPNKRARFESPMSSALSFGGASGPTTLPLQPPAPVHGPGVAGGLSAAPAPSALSLGVLTGAGSLGGLLMRSINLAPDVEEQPAPAVAAIAEAAGETHDEAARRFAGGEEAGGLKKKYAKEAWPGRHPGPSAARLV